MSENINQEKSVYLMPAFVDVVTFSQSYSDWHGWLTTAVCSLGILLNIMILLAMSKNKKSSFQTILIAIACADSITMAIYLPYSIHFYILNSNFIYSSLNKKRDTQFWAYYSLMKDLACETTHSISVWFTVYLSVYRYFFMRNSMNLILKKNNKKQSENGLVKFLTTKLKLVIFIICLFCIFFTSPKYLSSTVRREIMNETSNQTEYVYFVDRSDFNKQSNNLIFQISFYSHANFGKILPSFCLIIFISLILNSIHNFKKNKKKFQSSCSKV